MERLERAISDLESQNESGEDAPTAQLPQELYDNRVLREQVRQAMDDLSNEEGRRINLTDREARLMKTRQGVMPGYNAQAMASPARTADGQRAGMLITAVEVGGRTGRPRPVDSDAGQGRGQYGRQGGHDVGRCGLPFGAGAGGVRQQGPASGDAESQRRALRRPYHKDRFTYDESSDSYRCPQGQALRFIRIKRNHGVPMRRYRASGAVCRACPAFGTCTKDARYGRALEIGPHDAALRVHREWMSTDEASRSYERRQGLIEPVFGIIKDQQAGRRFLLRGIANVAAEWTLLATAFTCAPSGASGGPGRTCGVTDVPLGRQLRPESGDARSASPPSSPHTDCHDTPTRPSSDPTNQCSAPHHHQQPFVRQAPLGFSP